jgi:hypothetical protein
MICQTLTLTHLRGQIVRAAVVFSVLVDGVETLVDPDVVRFKVKVGAGTAVTYVYGVDAGVIRDELGKFHFDIATIAAAIDATWYVRAEGSGTYDGAAEGQFKVEAGEFV